MGTECHYFRRGHYGHYIQLNAFRLSPTAVKVQKKVCKIFIFLVCCIIGQNPWSKCNELYKLARVFHSHTLVFQKYIGSLEDFFNLILSHSMAISASWAL